MDTKFQEATTSEQVNCPICDSNSFELLYIARDYEYELPGKFHVSKCKQCDLIIQNPRPCFDEILRYYTEKYEPYNQVGSELVRKIRHFFLVRPRIKLYKKLIGDKGTIVDIGCSVGALLSELKDSNTNWTLLGVEPVEEVAMIAQEQGLNVIPTILEESHIPDNSIDLAIMNHVLEHLPDPVLTAAHVYKILKPGALFAGEIPSPKCIERVIFGKYWGGYHLPRHLTFF